MSVDCVRSGVTVNNKTQCVSNRKTYSAVSGDFQFLTRNDNSIDIVLNRTTFDLTMIRFTCYVVCRPLETYRVPNTDNNNNDNGCGL